MNKLVSLIKTDLNITFGISSLKYSIKNKKKRWTYIIFAAAMLSLIPSYIMMVRGLDQLYAAFRMIGQQSYFLMMGIMMSQFMIFFLGLLYAMSKYYFSSDTEQLLPLPIRPALIVGSKFTSLVISEYLVSLPIILPFILIFGIREYQSILYWLDSLLVIVLLPLLPLSIATILIMVFMKYTNIKSKKDLVRIIGALLFIFLVVFIQMKVNQIVSQGLMESESFLFDLARDAHLLVNKLGKAYPPAMWAVNSMVGAASGKGIQGILFYVAVSVIGTVIAVVLSEGLYLDGLIGNNESASRGKAIAIDDFNSSTRLRKPWLTLARKELTMLFKTPIYLMNSVGGVILVPILLVMSLFTSGSEIESIRVLLRNNEALVALGGAGMITILGMLNSVGVTTFSREGKNMWVQRTLPINPKDQIFGRVLASLAIQGMGAVILLVSISFVIPLSLTSATFILVTGAFGSILMTMLGMTIDILRPMREWTNPQQAMKQNINVLIGMGVTALLLGPIGLIIYNIQDMVPDIVILSGMPLLFMLLSLMDYRILHYLVARQLAELEE